MAVNIRDAAAAEEGSCNGCGRQLQLNPPGLVPGARVALVRLSRPSGSGTFTLRLCDRCGVRVGVGLVKHYKRLGVLRREPIQRKVRGSGARSTRYVLRTVARP